MAQGVTCQPVAAEPHVHSQASACGICGGKVALAQVILRLPRSFLIFVIPSTHRIRPSPTLRNANN
jgi:hypothetical protein